MVPVLVLLALTYTRGWFKLRSILPGAVSRSRLCAFLGGSLAVWAAVGSSLSELDHQLLSIHMVQHLLLSSVAAPLMLLGAPALPLLHGLPRRLVLDGVAPLLQWRPIRRYGGVFGHPVFCWVVTMVVFIGWHLPPVFQLGLQSEGWHALEHASFLGSGLLFWWPVVQPWPSVPRWPRWSMPLYLFLATLPCDVLAAFLAFSDRVVYPAYLSAPRHINLSVFQDQECAGAIMWLSVTIAYMVPAAVIMAGSLSSTWLIPAKAPSSARLEALSD